MATKAKSDVTIQTALVTQGEIRLRLIGKTPLIMNRMSAKAKRMLMIGGRKKTAAERLEIKHNPREEFLDTMLIDWSKEPYVWFDAMAIKSAMATAALVVPGIRKTDVQRLIFLPQERIPIYGAPMLYMNVMRSSDINRTPDIRTRAYFPQWATELVICYTEPALNQKAVCDLVQNAGLVCGIGDSRQEKGKGSFGTFRLMNDEEMPKYADVFDVAKQKAALETPVPADIESAELLAEYDAEVKARR